MKRVTQGLLAVTCLAVGTVALAAESGLGIAGVATTMTGNLAAVAKLITAVSYVAGLAFAVGAIVKFKAHKDNPTQIPIGTPIALLFVGAALIFMPSVITKIGESMFAASGEKAGVSGVATFGTGSQGK